jgi:hypothetical protein
LVEIGSSPAEIYVLAVIHPSAQPAQRLPFGNVTLVKHPPRNGVPGHDTPLLGPDQAK